MTLLVTGGAGFIGSAYVLAAIRRGDRVVVLDKLTYAGNLENLATVASHPRLSFVHGDIADRDLVRRVLDTHAPDALVNFAAESHVDNSIATPDVFLHTNVTGVLALLEAVRGWWDGRPFRLLHVSTDEVYGPIPSPARVDESAPSLPSSPYAASKVAAEGLVHAWHVTYGLPTLTTRGSNTYGPRQFPEKLIPRMIRNALRGEPLPVYGDGTSERDWMHVDDHVAGLDAVLSRGALGGRYNLGVEAERPNIEVVHAICAALDRRVPQGAPHARWIRSVADRRGHDRRYAIDATRARTELGWTARRAFDAGLDETVRWYVENPGWCDHVETGAYRSVTTLVGHGS